MGGEIIDKYIVEDSEIDLVNYDWDFLIILDACRYEQFYNAFNIVFNDIGTLKKAISPASWTIEWLNRVFKKEYYNDIVYISSNSIINSHHKVSLSSKFNDERSFHAKDHFYKIIDVWDFGWDEKLSTVPPIQVNKAFHKVYIRDPSKRFVLHYMQPHTPYISLGGEKNLTKIVLDDSNIHLEKSLKSIVYNLFSQRQIWDFKKLLDLPATSNIEQHYRKYGREGLIDVYQSEIVLVLKHIKMLVESIAGKWLITSDHGERLAHYWLTNHGARHDLDVTEVPWLEIDTREEIL